MDANRSHSAWQHNKNLANTLANPNKPGPVCCSGKTLIGKKLSLVILGRSGPDFSAVPIHFCFCTRRRNHEQSIHNRIGSD